MITGAGASEGGPGGTEPSTTGEPYDWLVVGAGSAGCVVASRLAHDAGLDVALVEAGPRHGPPGSQSFFDALAQPGAIWPHLVARRTRSQPPRPYPRGRGVGGCSTVNAMVALAGGPFADHPAAGAHLIPIESANESDLGPVDRALLRSAPDARPAPLTRDSGRRVSAADAYLHRRGEPAGRLDLLVDSAVRRVVFDGVRALGVELDDGRELSARRVVISTGAIHSPVLLMRGGVRVPGLGRGLIDHPSVPVTLELRPDAVVDPSSLASASLLERDSSQVLALNHLGREAPGYGQLLAALMDVVSQGRISLPDPDGPPEIDFGMLTHPDDIAGTAGALRIALELLEHPSFGDIVAHAFLDERGTGTEVLRDASGGWSQTAISEWVVAHVGDYVHAAGGCAMGAVVDSHCRVVGYEHLYVCDASVFATIPRVNTHLPTVMLAEVMAERWIHGGGPQ